MGDDGGRNFAGTRQGAKLEPDADYAECSNLFFGRNIAIPIRLMSYKPPTSTTQKL